MKGRLARLPRPDLNDALIGGGVGAALSVAVLSADPWQVVLVLGLFVATVGLVRSR